MRLKYLIAPAVLVVLSFTDSASAHLHPGLGRFVQRDPLQFIDGLNLSAYSRSSPVLRRDPSGLVCPPDECPDRRCPIIIATTNLLFDPRELLEPDPAAALEFPTQVELIAQFMELYFMFIFGLTDFEIHTFVKYDTCESVCCDGPRLRYRKRVGPNFFHNQCQASGLPLHNGTGGFTLIVGPNWEQKLLDTLAACKQQALNAFKQQFPLCPSL